MADQIYSMLKNLSGNRPDDQTAQEDFDDLLANYMAASNQNRGEEELQALFMQMDPLRKQELLQNARPNIYERRDAVTSAINSLRKLLSQ